MYEINFVATIVGLIVGFLGYKLEEKKVKWLEYFDRVAVITAGLFLVSPLMFGISLAEYPFIDKIVSFAGGLIIGIGLRGIKGEATL